MQLVSSTVRDWTSIEMGIENSTSWWVFAKIPPLDHWTKVNNIQLLNKQNAPWSEFHVQTWNFSLYHFLLFWYFQKMDAVILLVVTPVKAFGSDTCLCQRHMPGFFFSEKHLKLFYFLWSPPWHFKASILTSVFKSRDPHLAGGEETGHSPGLTKHPRPLRKFHPSAATYWIWRSRFHCVLGGWSFQLSTCFIFEPAPCQISQ